MKKHLSGIFAALIAAALCFSLIVFSPFSSLDNMLTDKLYSRLRQTNKDIIIITIDDTSLEAYGSFSTWSREKTADLIELLFSAPETSPAALGIDILFQGETNTASDKKLADTCAKAYGDIVLASAVNFGGDVKQSSDGSLIYDGFNIDSVEYPYAELRNNSLCGFANAFIGSDGINRYNMSALQTDDGTLKSFAGLLTELYCEKTGHNFEEPKTDSSGRFRFFYAGKSGEYAHVSLKTVLDGKVPLSEFKGKIVLLGAYASGMQDSYRATADVGSNMYGVEIQANIIGAILEGETALSGSKISYALIAAVFIILLVLFADKCSLPVFALVSAVYAGLNIAAGYFLSKNGILISQLYFIAIIAAVLIWIIIKRYVSEAKKRRQIVKTFGKYMEPRLVEQLAKEGSLESELKGKRRDVSVLFVDIRGFTSMSENLEPEEIVEILNSYLGHVTNCIFKHKGMLDKFIGDAAMAIFNAPIDQEDYLFESVAAAWDIAEGAKALEEELIARFGKSIGFGIGVNCGPAVIGNIGCDFRMDYTAIGDTVNTASRLESNAKRGEILISSELYGLLKERIWAQSAGEMTFKGKSGPMEVFRVTGIIG